MQLGIRPIVDLAFKRVFGTPENKLCLISLLNAILKPESPVVDVIIKNPFKLQEFEGDKLSILDIKAVDQNGRHFNVEIQLTIDGAKRESDAASWKAPLLHCRRFWGFRKPIRTRFKPCRFRNWMH